MNVQLEIIRRSQFFEIPTHLKIKLIFYAREIPPLFQRLIKAVRRYKHHLLWESFKNTQWAKWKVQFKHLQAYCLKLGTSGLSRGSGSYSSAFRHSGMGSIPGQSMWELRLIKRHWDRIFSQYFCFLLNV